MKMAIEFLTGMCIGMIVGGWFISRCMRMVAKSVFIQWEEDIKKEGVEEYLKNVNQK